MEVASRAGRPVRSCLEVFVTQRGCARGIRQTSGTIAASWKAVGIVLLGFARILTLSGCPSDSLER